MVQFATIQTNLFEDLAVFSWPRVIGDRKKQEAKPSYVLVDEIGELKELLDMDPSNPVLHHALAVAYLGEKSYINAVIHIESAVRLKSSEWEMYRDQAIVYIGLNRWMEAKRALDQALLLDPSQMDLFKMRAKVWSKMGRRREAERDLLLSTLSI